MRAVIKVDEQFSYSVGPESFTINYKPVVREGESNSLRSIEVHNTDLLVLREILTKIWRALPASVGTRLTIDESYDSKKDRQPKH